LNGTTNAVRVGETLALQATWVACPTPAGMCGDHYCDLTETTQTCPADCSMLGSCTGAETYVNLDITSYNLVTQREGMDIAWFATGGSFDDDRTGRASSDSANSTPNSWHAPTQPGPVYMWVVLRDDRGGVGWQEYTLDVR
jgi:hypothetical protein